MPFPCDENSPIPDDSTLPHMLLLMHPWFISSADLAQKLHLAYQTASSCDRSATCLKICNFSRFWIQEFPAAFNLDPQLACLMKEFEEEARSQGGEQHGALLDISAVPSYEWMRRVTRPSNACRGRRKVSLLFDHLEPEELAEHLTYMEHKVVRRIGFTDYQSYVLRGCLEENATLERSISLFNGVSQWVQIMVLSKPTALQRAEVITKFVHVAKKLWQLQNFNTLMAVVGGLSHSCISRLKETNSLIVPEVNKVWLEMTDLLSSSGNYGNYRRALAESEGFRVPILGVHLKDLIALHAAMPDRLKDDHINLIKLWQLYSTFRELARLQGTPPVFDGSSDLVHLLTLSLDLCHTEEEIYQLSLSREPRNSKTTTLTATKPVMIPEWISGVPSKPSAATINRHVLRMIESVFKNYDHDQDGYISEQDFGQIVANFPLLEFNPMVEKDSQVMAWRGNCAMPSRDGLVNKDEMAMYFLRASSILYHQLRPSFAHRFQETTFLRPTFCENCAGFMWGLLKQGLKCKDCGVICHKHCRELLLSECKKRSKSLSNESSPLLSSYTSPPGTPGLHTPNNGSDSEVFTFSPTDNTYPRSLQASESPPEGTARVADTPLRLACVCVDTEMSGVDGYSSKAPEVRNWNEGSSGLHTLPKMKAKRLGRMRVRVRGVGVGVNSGKHEEKIEKSGNSEQMISDQENGTLLKDGTMGDIAGQVAAVGAFTISGQQAYRTGQEKGKVIQNECSAFEDGS
uniref:RAS guanyl releasing protein 3 (calcium and DAG-regulated) n=1 Tax=Eptatretus burgeri TaxID=7764 RepID=A0A8C4R7C3_EPTBU